MSTAAQEWITLSFYTLVLSFPPPAPSGTRLGELMGPFWCMFSRTSLNRERVEWWSWPCSPGVWLRSAGRGGCWWRSDRSCLTDGVGMGDVVDDMALDNVSICVAMKQISFSLQLLHNYLMLLLWCNQSITSISLALASSLLGWPFVTHDWFKRHVINTTSLWASMIHQQFCEPLWYINSSTSARILEEQKAHNGDNTYTNGIFARLCAVKVVCPHSALSLLNSQDPSFFFSLFLLGRPHDRIKEGPRKEHNWTSGDWMNLWNWILETEWILLTARVFSFRKRSHVRLKSGSYCLRYRR